MAGMERFTQRARRVLSLAHQETERARHNRIGTEHLLIGLMLEEGGVAGRVLRELGLSTDSVRGTVKQITTASDNFDPSRVELGPQTQKTLEFAVEEARRLGHHYIGTEHILLGIVRVDDTAMDVFRRLGVTAEHIRRQTRRVLSETVSTSRSVSVDKTPSSKKIHQVFILHGQDEQKKTVAALIQILGLVPVLLDDIDKNEGKTLVEYLDKHFDDIALGIIILSDNDTGILRSDLNLDVQLDHNVIYELGYFRGKLGQNHVYVLYTDDFQKEVDLLSDLKGIIYMPLDNAGSWMTQLAEVIKDVGSK